MVLEIAAMVSAVEAVGALIKTATSVIQDIRKNDDAKKQLADSMEKLRQSLTHAGELAQAAENYFQTFQNVLELRLLCSRAEDFLRENIDECRDRERPDYEGDWKILQIMLQTIETNSQVARQVVMQCANWYDRDDNNQITLLIQQFTTYYDGAKSDVNHREANDLLRDLHDMTTRLLDVETLLGNTIYKKILMALKNLSH
jgi:hypothetical protein